jgi:SAM-dependent methyltransferase
MGRVAIELATRGIETVGIDLDPDLLFHAQQNAPSLTWQVGDLADFDLGRTFDVVVAAGNVIGFVDEENRSKAVQRCAAHVAHGGRLITGYSLNGKWPAPHLYDGWCADVGLELEARYSTWDGDPFEPASKYAVTVHRRPA